MTMMRADVAVVGGGPAGIAAAATAAETGAQVALIDDSPRPGGQIWRHSSIQSLPPTARPWLQRLADVPVQVLSGMAVVDATVHAEGVKLLLEPVDRHDDGTAIVTSVECRKLVLATGARELFLPFPGWTLPGVFGVGGGQALLKSGMDVRDRRVVIAGSGPLLLPVAAAFTSAGAEVIEVIEQAPLGRLLRFGAALVWTPARIAEAVRLRRAFANTPYRTGSWVSHAAGDEQVRTVHISHGSHERTVECDMLCVGYGLVPSIELARLIGCRTEAGRVLADTDQRTSLDHVYAAGEPTGIGGMDAALVEGQIAGMIAAGGTAPRRLRRRRDSAGRFATALDRTFRPRAELLDLARPDTVVCRCEDVTLERIRACGGIREAKLTTRAGMGACQARVCGAALNVMFDWSTDTVRTPLYPADVGTLMDMTAKAPRAPGEQHAEE